MRLAIFAKRQVIYTQNDLSYDIGVIVITGDRAVHGQSTRVHTGSKTLESTKYASVAKRIFH